MKKETTEGLVFYLNRIRETMTSLGKWLLLAVVSGCVVGGISTLFAFVLTKVTVFLCYTLQTAVLSCPYHRLLYKAHLVKATGKSAFPVALSVFLC